MCELENSDAPITRAELAGALRSIRNDAHDAYMLGRERESERGHDRRELCEALARELDLDLGPLP